MGYIPSYNSIYDSASVQVDTRTVSNNTIENFEENAKSVGVNVDRDVNGNLIGYSTNQTVTSYENGEYVERTIKIPLTATVNPNSTNENLIIDYVPSNTYTTTDNEHYEPGSVNYVMDKNEYLKGVMSANGYELDIDQIDTSILDALWEAYNQDVTHHSGLIHNPIVEALGDAAGIDPSIVESDTMALARLKISDLGLKFLDSDTNVARILKAAASVGMTTVGDVIEDDPATREYFRYHVQAGDYVTLTSPVRNPQEDWVGAFIRPMLYRNQVDPTQVLPTEEQLSVGYTIDSGQGTYPDYDLIPDVLDTDIRNATGKYMNLITVAFGGKADGGTLWVVGTNFFGWYGDPDIANAEVVENYPTRGYAKLKRYGTIYLPNHGENWRRGYVYNKGSDQMRWQGVGNGYDDNNNFILVYSYDDFSAYLADLMNIPDYNTANALAGSWFVYANCRKASTMQGVTKRGDALNVTANDTIVTIKEKMQQQYPDWYNTSITQNEYNIYNNTTTPTTYLPISFNNDTPQNAIVPRETIEKSAVYNYQYTYNQTPSNPEPQTQVASVEGIMKSNRFWTVYQPTGPQLDQLGSKLWDQNFIDLLKQTFMSPTDGIIALQQLYVKLPATATRDIYFGRYNTEVEAMVVEKFVFQMDCGVVKVPRYYNDPRDFTETSVNIYLPFIGFKELDPKDVIGGAISLKYRIDVLTGTCVAFISPRKAEANPNSLLDTQLTTCAYTFAGNCAVQLPITAADRSRILSGMVGGLGVGGFGGAKIGGTVGAALGGPLGGFMGAGIGGGVGAGLGMLVGGLSGNQRGVYRSSEMNANAGALALTFVPYILVDRMVPADAYQYPKFYGQPNNTTIALQLCQGFTRVKDVVFNTVNASEVEKQEIEKLLKTGIFI